MKRKKLKVESGVRKPRKEPVKQERPKEHGNFAGRRPLEAGLITVRTKWKSPYLETIPCFIKSASTSCWTWIQNQKFSSPWLQAGATANVGKSMHFLSKHHDNRTYKVVDDERTGNLD